MFNFTELHKELNNWLNECSKESYIAAFQDCIKKHPKITMDEFYESEITLQNQEIKILENLGSLEFDQIAILNKRKKLVGFYKMVRSRSNAHMLILLQERCKIIYSQWIEILKSFPNDYLHTTIATKQIQEVETLAEIEMKSEKYLTLFEYELKDEFVEHELIRLSNVFKHGIESLYIEFNDLKYNANIKNNIKTSVIITKDNTEYTIPYKTAYSFNWKEFYTKIKKQDFNFGYGLSSGEMVSYIIGLVKFATKLVKLRPDLFDLTDSELVKNHKILQDKINDKQEFTEIINILFLGASPIDEVRLRIDEEFRDIENGLKLVRFHDQFELKSKWAVTAKTLQQAMLDEHPKIVHFSGHGDISGIAVEDIHGNSKLIENDAIGSLFELFATTTKCVVLNSCYSESQAREIAKHIPYVVGMKNSVNDKAAIAFAVGFYSALGAGKDIKFAFEMGKVAVKMEGISGSELPILIER